MEDRAHELLLKRYWDVYNLFGQFPDILEGVWVLTAQGQIEEAQRIIDAVPQQHPFELRFTAVAKVDWESCQTVLDAAEKRRILSKGW